ncbi:MAG TPA: glycoside hydrolase family 36 protein [Bryobacteraceae bacterium]|nr:glycoside hydrolase family 36 protein [Bryobacteraceae bacterium]
MRITIRSLLPIAATAWAAAGAFAGEGARVEGKSIRIDFDGNMHSRVVAALAGHAHVIGDFTPSEVIVVSGREIDDFLLQAQKREAVRDRFGSGFRTLLTGVAPSLKKTVAVTVYDAFPAVAIFEVAYTNTGASDLLVNGWTNQHYSISAGGAATSPAFWSYQSGSYEKRPDWVLPLKPGFRQENFLGMNAPDYGGGTPVVDVWRRDAGIAVGHLEMAPKLVSLPVTEDGRDRAAVAVTFQQDQMLKPGETLKTFRTFAVVHEGDYFRALRDYRDLMMAQGVRFDRSPDSAFEPIWCAWGYGRKCTPSQVYGALPMVKKLGFTWVTLDDGWQTTQGDWHLQPRKYPNGDADMRAFVARIHAEGFKAQLWWAPLAADPGSDIVQKHPQWLLLDKDGRRQKISYWNSWYLCPADPEVIAYHQAIVAKVIGEWGFDGLKLDGQHMNGAPPCYNPAHKHARPEDSVEGMPRFFEALYEAARHAKPDALVEFCPCGTAYSFFTLPFLNMSVASDPESAWQVRTKGKTLKALAGDQVAYFGDHVDMYKDDFASAIGVGGVVGTNFTWPEGSAGRKRGDLTPVREQEFAKWIRIYKEKMLSRGEYLGTLYDIGFDRPEAHAVRKGGNMYYAFYAPEWSGPITLRGLSQRAYRVTGYAEGKDFGTVHGPAATLHVQFQKHLLLEAEPE